MGTDERNYLGRPQSKWSHDPNGFVLDRLGFGARFNLPDRSLRPFRDEASLQLFGRQTRGTAALQDAYFVSNGSASALSRIHHRVLGNAKDDGWSSLLRHPDHGLHSGGG